VYFLTASLQPAWSTSGVLRLDHFSTGLFAPSAEPPRGSGAPFAPFGIGPEERAETSPSGLSVERLETPGELLALGSACDALARLRQPQSPFATRGWLTRWWDQYREDGFWLRDRFYVHTVRDAQHRLLAVAPLLMTERPARGPLRARGLSFFGSDKNVTELRGMLCAPEHEDLATRALLEHLWRIREDWDWLIWHGVRRDSEAHARLSRLDEFRWLHETVEHVLPLPATWEEFRGTRSRNIKESLRKCYNSLKRDGHSFEFRVVTEPQELAVALEKFFELHQRRAQATHLVDHRDVFSLPQARRLMFEVAAASGEAPAMHAFQLVIAGEIVAMRLGFVLGDELYLYFSGFEPSWAQYSVMTTTVAEAIKWAIHNRLRMVNLSPGTDVSKTRWGAEQAVTCDGVLVSPTTRARWVFGALTELNLRSRPGTPLGRVVDRIRRGA